MACECNASVRARQTAGTAASWSSSLQRRAACQPSAYIRFRHWEVRRQAGRMSWAISVQPSGHWCQPVPKIQQNTCTVRPVKFGNQLDTPPLRSGCGLPASYRASRRRCSVTASPSHANAEEEHLSAEEEAELLAMLEKTMQEGLGAGAPPHESPDPRHEALSHVEIAEVVKMGSWRLAGLLDPPFELLESQIEGMWRELVQPDLSLFPMPQDMKYCDTADPEHRNPMSYRDESWPTRGQPGYPRMQLENRCYQSRVFRRLHMELVHRQDSIQVLHCVMYPRLEYDLPILSMDMVGKVGGAISLAVIDACPVATNRSLPPQYVSLLQKLQEQYGMVTNRATPEWGRSIFSDLCVILRPKDPQDVSNFLQYALAVTRVHLQMARLAKPVQSNTKTRLADIKAAHARYCEQQLLNDKTTRVLESGFGKEFSERYMRTVVFDEAPESKDEASD